MWVKLGLREIGPFNLVMYRSLFASLALGVVILARRMKPFPWQYLGIFLVVGLLNAALPFALVAWSEKYISSGMASILNSSVPLFTLVLAPLFLPEEKITRSKLGGLVLGFGGILLLVGNQITENFRSIGIGQLLMLSAAVSYALASIFARKYSPQLKSEWQAFLQMSAAFLFLLPTALLVEGSVVWPTQAITWVSILWMGVMGSCISLLIFFDLLRSVGPTRTVLVSYIFPVAGVILGVIFLDEQISARMMIAGVIILFGVILVNHSKKEVKNE